MKRVLIELIVYWINELFTESVDERMIKMIKWLNVRMNRFKF